MYLTSGFTDLALCYYVNQMAIFKFSKTNHVLTTSGLFITLLAIAMFSTPLQNTLTTLLFFVILGFLIYNLIKLIWWLFTRKENSFGNRLFVVVAIGITVAVMLNSASKLSLGDVLVIALIGAGVLTYMRWRFARY